MKRITGITLTLALAVSSASSVPLVPTQSKAEICEAGGGCHVVTREALMQLAQRAYRAGQATCEKES